MTRTKSPRTVLSRVLSGAIFFAAAAGCGSSEEVTGRTAAQREGGEQNHSPSNSGPGNPDPGKPGKGRSVDAEGEPPGPASGPCTYTQGYWKNHEAAWPVDELTLGGVTYSKAQLLAIFREPVQGNGLVALAHQLIAARLNGASGPDAGTAAEADALIGDLVVPPVGDGFLPTSQTSGLNDRLTAFNEGRVGPGHCEKGGRPPAPPAPPPGGDEPPPGEQQPPPPPPPPAPDAGTQVIL